MRQLLISPAVGRRSVLLVELAVRCKVLKRSWQTEIPDRSIIQTSTFELGWDRSFWASFLNRFPSLRARRRIRLLIKSPIGKICPVGRHVPSHMRRLPRANEWLSGLTPWHTASPRHSICGSLDQFNFAVRGPISWRNLTANGQVLDSCVVRVLSPSPVPV